MRKCSLLVLGCCLLLSGCSGAPTGRSLLQDLLKIVNDLNDVLLTVKDKASADAARPKLDALSQRMKKLGEQMGKVGAPTKDDKEWMEKDFKPAMQAASTKLGQTMQNIEDPEIKKKATEIMMEWLSAAMKKAGEEK